MLSSQNTRRRLLALFAATPLCAALAACGKEAVQFKGSNISGTKLGEEGVALTDQDGQPRTLADYAGKVVVVFFGFTQCPDVCPTALAELSQVMGELGPDAKRVQVVLITVDPERDTPEILKQYVQAFNPSFAGLTGTPEQIKAAANSFKAYYAKSPSPDGSTYTMDHTGAFYLMDTKGKARVLVPNGSGVQAMTHDIKLLLDEG